jgi:16S rRNA (cytosine1402-N4)-methyltransferase
MHDVKHVSVLPREVLHWLDPQPGQIVVDATTGVGGHSALLWDRIHPGGTLIALDQDAAMLEISKSRLGNECTISPLHTGGEGPGVRGLSHNQNAIIHWRQANFEDLSSVLDELKIPAVDAILADLGFCSDQMSDPARGFSFHADGPLDMRLDTSRGEPASELIRRGNEKDLADIFWQYGEERFSRRVARKIAETRQKTPITTTAQLADLVRSCVPRSRGHSIDPATRVFQALRIAVNDELGALERFLQVAPSCLKPGGRVAIISFHSLEDRLVKQTFRKSAEWGKELTRKPVTASDAEISVNPRARSAKLRVAQKHDSPVSVRSQS